jgi:hypothetical protein
MWCVRCHLQQHVKCVRYALPQWSWSVKYFHAQVGNGPPCCRIKDACNPQVDSHCLDELTHVRMHPYILGTWQVGLHLWWVDTALPRLLASIIGHSICQNLPLLQCNRLKSCSTAAPGPDSATRWWSQPQCGQAASRLQPVSWIFALE